MEKINRNKFFNNKLDSFTVKDKEAVIVVYILNMKLKGE